MKVHFSKYHGAGNDFIIIDNRTGLLNLTSKQINNLCHRQLGIGADGLMLLEKDESSDFRMKYFNSDGNEGTMCGNGGRCLVMFAKKLGLIDKITHFVGVDGVHEAILLDDNSVRLKMSDVNEIIKGNDYYIIDTGSPHYVQFVCEVDHIDVTYQGRVIRDNHLSKNGGVNANFAQYTPEGIKIRTYERGVEAETLACGTGAVATAIAANHWFKEKYNSYTILALGGTLKINFEKISENQFRNIWLEGPVAHVFDGETEI
ncbi:MAG: diaminopimelate epimerase [Bacteroidetes bacterium HGW-Bacteroidetes-15]|nr:MAG: diaminopimelate epimerase [Bacteroidetes bacterium HGW-Bacteroidetes-15]